MINKKIICVGLTVIFTLCLILWRFDTGNTQSTEVVSANEVNGSTQRKGKDFNQTNKEASPIKIQDGSVQVKPQDAIAQVYVGPKSLLQLRKSVDAVKDSITLATPKPYPYARDAFLHLRRNVSFSNGKYPQRWIEDGIYLYFSEVYDLTKVNDFANGFAVRKKTGEIIQWHEMTFDQPFVE